jgi:magnesium chelatase family protein
VDSSKALPTIEIIGLADIMIKEAKERIRGTFRNCNIKLPNLKFILNLAPSDIRKVGTGFDLPMALSLLLLMQEGHFQHKDKVENGLFFGELGLDGSVKRINGLLPCVLSAKKK